MKRLLPLLLLAACTEAQAPAPATPVEAPAPPPAPNSPEEAAQIARSALKSVYGGYRIDMGTPGPTEGAAGSLYIEVPATLTAPGGESFPAKVTLRRVNDVPGSTTAQRRWHVQSIDLPDTTGAPGG